MGGWMDGRKLDGKMAARIESNYIVHLFVSYDGVCMWLLELVMELHQTADDVQMWMLESVDGVYTWTQESVMNHTR